jgi:purine-binding chemotaxis protein CheW
VLDSPELEPRPTVRGRWSGDSIAGIGRRNGQFVTVLDLDHLLGDLQLPETATGARAA